MANALEEVQATYSTINEKYNLLRLACKDDTNQLADLATQYANAQTAYMSCVGQMLDDGDAAVAVLSAQLKDANGVVAESVKEMGDMSKVIDDITQAVTIGAKLVTEAGL